MSGFAFYWPANVTRLWPVTGVPEYWYGESWPKEAPSPASHAKYTNMPTHFVEYGPIIGVKTS